MSTAVANHREGVVQLDTHFYNEQVSRIIEQIIPQFERMIVHVVLFQCVFAVLGFIELFFFISFFPFLAESSYIAFALALMFLTLFGYFTLRLYFKSRQPEQFREVSHCFYKECYQLLDAKEEIPEHYVTLANALCKFSSALNGREHNLYRPPQGLRFFEGMLERLSLWCHGQDILEMRELLLRGSVDEHLKLVKAEPTSLEAHAALANAYVMLSELYRHEPEKFRKTAKRAIEELHILHDFAPTDPWIHVQLAYSYHDLQMPEEEMREYEEVLELCPNDYDSLYKLGILYFQQGMNAKGLKVYEILKKKDLKKAQKLIERYGLGN